MNKLLLFILFTGICVSLLAQTDTNGVASPEDSFNLKVDNGNYTITPMKPNKSLNDQYNNGRASISKYGSLMAFTRCHYKIKGMKKILERQIFFRNLVKGKWSAPKPFLLNSENYSVGHPCLSSDGKTMYFDSDMPGGFGKSDLYRISRNDNGTWGKAENLGSKINTEGDEMYPFFKEDGQILFFSSNGRFGLGGLDIFIYALNLSGFGKVYNAGFPLNTRYDDFALNADPVLKKSYFISNRSKGKGKGDLYSVIFH